ncbi:MAG: DUF4390 domain-containing protein [Gammaproteobacteria bacterium]|nr:DUF4390 domain-containing protein [Gammaproteobacteria bacterium]MBT8123276.1 DUF4390 domain-containing protein [Gammaproteobacteria bacterium]
MNLILLQKRAITVLLVISITTLMYAFVSESAQARTIAIEVNYLNIAELNDELRLDAEIAYELNSEVREALINGIPMVFQVEVQIVALQKWLWDKVIITTVKTHLLKYHILSKQYVLENLETGESVSFPDLESVLSKQGSVSAMYIAETDYLKEQENYVVQLRSRLLSSELPLPLRMKSYFSPKWRLDSGWYQWPL